MDLICQNRKFENGPSVNRSTVASVNCRSHFGYVLFAIAFVCAFPASAQHVYKCVDWKGAVTFQSERCSDRDRIERVYDTSSHIEVGGRAVRNFVPSAAAGGGLAPTYGQPMNSDGSNKSDALCGVAQAATASRPYRNIELLAADAALRSAHCNHSRGPGG